MTVAFGYTTGAGTGAQPLLLSLQPFPGNAAVDDTIAKEATRLRRDDAMLRDASLGLKALTEGEQEK